MPAHIELLAQRVARGRYHLRTLPSSNAQLFLASDELTRERLRSDKKLYPCTVIVRSVALQLYLVIFDPKMQEAYE